MCSLSHPRVNSVIFSFGNFEICRFKCLNLVPPNSSRTHFKIDSKTTIMFVESRLGERMSWLMYRRVHELTSLCEKNEQQITHMLDVQLVNPPINRDHARKIRRELAKLLWNVTYTFDIVNNGQKSRVSITWMRDSVVSMFGYSIDLPYMDEMVGLHCNFMLTKICREIRSKYPSFGDNKWGISYLISKPKCSHFPTPKFAEVLAKMYYDDSNDNMPHIDKTMKRTKSHFQNY
jgi:hypothetical protein